MTRVRQFRESLELYMMAHDELLRAVAKLEQLEHDGLIPDVTSGFFGIPDVDAYTEYVTNFGKFAAEWADRADEVERQLRSAT